MFFKISLFYKMELPRAGPTELECWPGGAGAVILVRTGPVCDVIQVPAAPSKHVPATRSTPVSANSGRPYYGWGAALLFQFGSYLKSGAVRCKL